MHLEEITASLVNSAVEIYLRLAYGGAVSREKHATRFPPELPLAEVLAQFVSEDTPSAKSWSLRLGSEQYPHMKFLLRGTCIPGEYVFCVDRHDCVLFDNTIPGHTEWAALQGHNYALKKQIEEAWYAAGLPTVRGIREKMRQHSPDAPLPAKQETVLLVDNEPDALEIFAIIVGTGGYKTRTAATAAQAWELLNDPEIRFAAAVVDLVMEDGFGGDLLAKIRSAPRISNLPAIVMTGMAKEYVKNLEFFDGYLQKPFSASAMLQALNDAINHGVGDLTPQVQPPLA